MKSNPAFDKDIGGLLRFRIDKEPPYQREEVWTNTLKQNLIVSIFRNIPINALHLVESPNNNGFDYIVLDGKQRYTAIEEFNQNKFSIPFNNEKCALYTHELQQLHQSKDSNLVRMYWSDIQNSSDEEWKKIGRNFLNYNVKISQYECSSLDEQAKYFEVINYSMPLNVNEINFARYYQAKRFFNYVFDEIKNTIDIVNYKTIQSNDRYAGARYILTLWVLCFGTTSDDIPSARNVDFKKRDKGTTEKTLENIHNFFIGCDTDNDLKIRIENNKVFHENIRRLYKITKLIKSIVQCKSEIAKINKCVFRDVVLSFMSKIYFDQLTESYISENKNKFRESFMTYHEKLKEKRLTNTSGEEKIINIRLRELEKLYEEYDIDLNRKNMNISNKVKNDLLILDPPTNCPISGERLTDTNIQFDHVLPKSKYSSTPVEVLSDESNRIKSNISPEQIKKIDRFYDEKLSKDNI